MDDRPVPNSNTTLVGDRSLGMRCSERSLATTPLPPPFFFLPTTTALGPPRHGQPRPPVVGSSPPLPAAPRRRRASQRPPPPPAPALQSHLVCAARLARALCASAIATATASASAPAPIKCQGTSRRVLLGLLSSARSPSIPVRYETLYGVPNPSQIEPSLQI